MLVDYLLLQAKYDFNTACLSEISYCEIHFNEMESNCTTGEIITVYVL